MNALSSESLAVETSEDIVKVRQAVRKKAVELGFGLVDQTKIVTASSELARNTLDYGGGGFVLAICPVERQRAVRERLPDMRELPIKFDSLGTRVVLNVVRDIWV